MSEHCGYVVAVEKLRPHTNADRLQVVRPFSVVILAWGWTQ